MTEEPNVYNKGDVVPTDGKYVCSPCGYHHEYKAGETFGECTSCMAGSTDGHPDYVDGTGLWEKASEPET